MKNQNQKKIYGEMKMGKKDLSTRLWIETKKLWVIVGPSIISPVASYSMNIITQAFAGHLGDVQLAAISIANTAIVGFNFGLIAFTCKDHGSVLKLFGQLDDVGEMSGVVAIWLIPLHFSFVFQFPLQRFLQSQLKTRVLAYVSFCALGVNVLTSWVFVNVLDWGVIGASLALDIS
ncbi:protein DETOXIFICATION 27-like [Gossypium hirsutum]|uniref:Protein DETOXIFICATION 27-like n=1 Tax=Gossypium hirsutum TaxID=3635 RepID=A0A1U8J663_GOSHI|nr:protein DETOXIFICATION 27-like [Gossypium hirsutum]